MATLDDLATFVTAADATLISNTNLFTGQLPNGPTTVTVALIERGGQRPVTTFGASAITSETVLIEVIVRGAASDYATPRATAETLYRAFETASAQTLGSTKYAAFNVTFPPSLYGKDAAGRPIIGFTVNVMKEPTA